MDFSMDLFDYLAFLENSFLTKELIYLKIYILCDYTSFEYHTSLEVFLIFRVMQIKMKVTYSLADKRQKNHWKMEKKK